MWQMGAGRRCNCRLSCHPLCWRRRHIVSMVPCNLSSHSALPAHPSLPRSYGVAFLHETQSEEEQAVARLLFESGAVQVLVATAPMCWGLTAAAHLTVIMGTQVGRHWAGPWQAVG